MGLARAEVAEDGSFRFERLHACPWQVRLFEPCARLSAGGRMITQRVPEPDVHVVAGDTVEYEHRAEVLARARLSGHITIDGAPPGPLVVIVNTTTPEAAIARTQFALDPARRFEVSLQSGLKASIWSVGPYRGTTIRVSADVSVAPGDNEWSFGFESARLEVHLDPSRVVDSPPNQVTYVVERGTVTVRVPCEPSEPSHDGPYVVPAGRGRLDAPNRSELLAPAPVLSELELAPGELRVLDLR